MSGNWSNDPNSQNQLWSKWTFKIFDGGKILPEQEVFKNLHAWLIKGFGTAGRFKLERDLWGWKAVVEIEGPPANDKEYIRHVKTQFQKNFVEQGWGNFAVGTVAVKILSGDKQDGTDRSQLIVLPSIKV